MMKRNRLQRATAFLTAVLTVLSLTTYRIGYDANARAVIPELPPYTSTDYNTLLGSAYIINPAWTTLTPAAQLSYTFRGEAHSETYNSTRHFSTFAAAYAAFEASYTNPDSSIDPGFATATPVFVLAAGTYTEPRMTVRCNAIILGANAGISPNSVINLDTANPTAGWAASTSRATETVISNGFARTTRVSDSAENTKYETPAVAAGADTFTLTIDGIKYEGTGNLVDISDTTTAHRNSRVNLRSSILKITASVYVFDDSNSAMNDNNYEVRDVRITDSSLKGIMNVNVSSILIDGLYFANNSGCLSGNMEYSKTDFTFDMRNSYLYKNSNSYPLYFRYTQAEHKSHIIMDGNIWYESAGGAWGFIVFCTTATTSDSEYKLDIAHNTIMCDKSFNTAGKNTLFNGNASEYQLGRYTLNFNYNRVIGFTSMFLSIDGTTEHINTLNIDMNYNYFAPSYSGNGDVLGRRSAYYSSTPYNDPINIDALIYYSDYMMTTFDGDTDVTGVSFYNDVDYVGIDNDNSVISVGMSTGTITNPTLYFAGEGITQGFYSNYSCTNSISSITAPAAGATLTVYAKATKGSTSRVFTVRFYGADNGSASSFSYNYSDPAGQIERGAYLYAPQTAGMSNGSRYTISWEGTDYYFTVGTNVFSTLSDIFAKSGTAQILIPYGSYGNLEITEACEIFGENYMTPPMQGSGLTPWYSGTSWRGASHSSVDNITISAENVTISGLTITGKVSQTNAVNSTPVLLTNSIIDVPESEISESAQITLNGGSGTFGLDSVWIRSLSSNASGISRLFGGTLPAYVNLTKCYSDFDGALTLGACGNSCNFSMTDNRFDNLSGETPLIADNNTFGGNPAITVTNNLLTSSAYGNAYIFELTPSAYRTVSITGNIVLCDGTSSGGIMYAHYNSSTTNNISFSSNRIIGIRPLFDGSGTDTTGNIINGSYNYYSSYSEDFSSASTGKCPEGHVKCSKIYFDYAMTQEVNAIGEYSFTNKDGLTTDLINRRVELTLGYNVTSFDLTNGYISNPNNNDITAIYIKDELAADITNISLDDHITNVRIKVSAAGNDSVFEYWTLTVYRAIPAACEILNISTDKAGVYLDNLTGNYTLVLPYAESDAALSLTLPDGAHHTLSLDGATVTGISGITGGMTKSYRISVTNGTDTVVYTLNVSGDTMPGNGLDYEAYIDSAYIINNAWTSSVLTNGNVLSFYYRGTTRTQSYDSARHFASYADAYAAHYATVDETNISTDMPVFIFAPGTYNETVVLHGNGIILGANAGINPNDPTVAWDYTNFTTGWASNIAWSTANETVLAGGISRGTRDGSNETGPYQYYLELAENGNFKTEIVAIADGVVMTGTHGFTGLDYDVGTVAENGGASLVATGLRTEHRIIQNSMVRDFEGSSTERLFSFSDDSEKINYAYTRNVRFINVSANGLFYKYIKSAYIDGCAFVNHTNKVFGQANDVAFGTSGTYSKRDQNQTVTMTHSVWANNNVHSPFRFGFENEEEGGNSITATFDDNIFYNSTDTSGTYGIFVAYNSVAGRTVTLNIQNNQFYQDVSDLNGLFNSNATYQTATVNYNITGNRIIGRIKGITSTLLPNSAVVSPYIDRNYYADNDGDEGKPLGCKDSPVLQSGFPNGFDMAAQAYYHDAAMTFLNTDYQVSSIDVGDSGASNPAVNNVLKILSFQLLTGNAGSVVFNVPAGATVGVYSNEACTTAANLADVEYDIHNQQIYTYYVKTSKLGKSNVYTLLISAVTAEEFATAYIDASGKIDRSSAILLDPACTGLTTGTTHYARWNGTYYGFTAGVNAFGTLDDIYSFADANGIDAPQVLTSLISGDLIITHSVRLYAPNFATKPFIDTAGVGASANGADWEENPAYMANQVTVGSITVAATASGTIEMHGFTFTYRFYDQARPTTSPTTNIKLENMMLNTTSNLGYVFRIDNAKSKNTGGDPNSQDSFTAKNFYLKKAGNGSRLIGKYCAARTTFDGMWLDGVAANMNGATAYVDTYANDSVFTIKNSNIRNWHRTADSGGAGPITFEGYEKALIGAGKSNVIVFDNNTLYRFSMQYGGDRTRYVFRWYDQSFSGMQFINNYVERDDVADTGSALIYSNNGAQNVRADGSIVITGNKFNGMGKSFNVESGSNTANDKIVLDRNYLSETLITDFAAAPTGVRATTNMGTVSDINGWYFDFAMTRYSGDVQEISFHPSVIYNAVGRTATIAVSAATATLDLSALVNNPYDNIIGYYSDSECTLAVNAAAITVPAAGTTVYMKLSPPYGTAASQIITVTIVKGGAYAVSNSHAGTASAGGGFNWVGWRAIVTATGSYVTDPTFGAANQRFGVIYVSDGDVVDTIKQTLSDGIASIDAAVAAVNAASTNTYGKAYIMPVARTLSWDDGLQGMSYRYNFKIAEGKRRATVMYVVYEDESGVKHISFSELNIQTSTIG